MERLLWKVCGMREHDNISHLINLSPDFIGFIFYDKSSRFVKEIENIELIKTIPSHIKKVGVFVNEPLDSILQIVKEYRLDYVQLHGGESVEYCQKIADEGIKIFKVISIKNHLDIAAIKPFDGIADYFLFDTKTPKYGGSGEKFDWNILKEYSLKTPYILSGGIGIDDFNDIDRKNFPGLTALDVNSKFEIQPGLKDIQELKELKNKIISNNDSYESISKV